MKQKHLLPEWMYNALPYVCVIVGALVPTFLTSNLIAVGSCMLLLASGLLAFRHRLEVRLKRQDIAKFGTCTRAHTCPNKIKY